MQKKKVLTLLQRIIAILLIILLLLFATFLIGRYGWKLGGFNACETAGIEQVNVEEDHVRIRGFYPGSFPRGFLGYHAEQVDNTLYVGFKFSALFGMFETGDFDITIPTKGTVTQVVVKSGEHEYTVWPKEDVFESETEVTAVPIVYEQILSQYRTALEGNWSTQRLVEEGLNVMVKDILPEKVGYAVDDLDDDGTPEFIIGTIYGDDFYDALVFVLYTVDDEGKPVQIFSSTERDRYYYAGGIRFANLVSSAFDDSFVTTLKLEGEGLVDMTFTTAPSDYVQMQFEPIAEGKNEEK